MMSNIGGGGGTADYRLSSRGESSQAQKRCFITPNRAGDSFIQGLINSSAAKTRSESSQYQNKFLYQGVLEKH